MKLLHFSFPASLLFALSSLSAAPLEPDTFDEPAGRYISQSPLPQLRVEQNRFVSAATGETVILRGLAASDPAALLERGQWNRRYFEAISEWNANVVRIPVHPADWRKIGEADYLAMLDQAVTWSEELGLYVIFDWHTIGNILTGVYHRKSYETSRDETFRFWYTIANRYRNNPTIAFYELYNEPTTRGGKMGAMPWEDYAQFIEGLISMIYAIDDTIIPLVAGLDWGYDLSYVAERPIRHPGVAYVTHPYPQKRPAPWQAAWQEDWGFVADTYPIIATEFGFMSEDGPGAHIPVIGDEAYGEAIIQFFEDRGISWTPWVFDPLWSPQLVEDWDFTPTRQGAFFRQKMMELNP